MSPRAIRGVVAAVFVLGIAGMIVGSILDNNGVAITFGLFTAAGALCLLTLTAATTAGTHDDEEAVTDDEQAAEAVEAAITGLVDAGADEQAVRDLVRRAVALGRGGGRRHNDA